MALNEKIIYIKNANGISIKVLIFIKTKFYFIQLYLYFRPGLIDFLE